MVGLRNPRQPRHRAGTTTCSDGAMTTTTRAGLGRALVWTAGAAGMLHAAASLHRGLGAMRCVSLAVSTRNALSRPAETVKKPRLSPARKLICSNRRGQPGLLDRSSRRIRRASHRRMRNRNLSQAGCHERALLMTSRSDRYVDAHTASKWIADSRKRSISGCLELSVIGRFQYNARGVAQ